MSKDDFPETVSLWHRFCAAFRGWLSVPIQIGELYILMWATAPLGGLSGDRRSVHQFQDDIQYTVLDIYRGGSGTDRDRDSRVAFPQSPSVEV